MIKRRQFLAGSALAGIGIGGASVSRGLAIDPFNRPGRPQFRVGLAAYSFRDYFVDMTHERRRPVDRSKRITMLDFIDYCAEQDVGAEVTSYYFPPDVGRDFLLAVKRRAFLRGVPICGTSVGNKLTLPPGPERKEQLQYVKRWIRHAAVMGAPHLRVFAGASGQLTHDEAMDLCLEGLADCCRLAEEQGVMLGIENHGGITAEADDLLHIVRSIDSPWLGINLDSANFHTEDPYRDFDRCAPYAVNVQLKTEIRRRGAKKEKADTARFLESLKAANYQGYVTLEYEAEEDPYDAVPAALADLRQRLT